MYCTEQGGGPLNGLSANFRNFTKSCCVVHSLSRYMEIFEDAPPPFSGSLPPPVLPADPCIVVNEFNPQQAFTIFADKIVKLPTSTANHAYVSSTTTSSTTILSRLATLQTEMAQLQTDMTTLSNLSHTSPSLSIQLDTISKDLDAKLQTLQSTSATVSSNHIAAVQGVISDHLANLDTKSPTTGPNVTYELFAPAPSGASTASTDARITALERSLATVTPSAVTAAAATAKLIKADLTAAVNATQSVPAPGLSATNPLLKPLYDKFLSLEAIHHQLPAIVERLTVLRTLHGDAATFKTRLCAVEQDIARAGAGVAGIEESLESVASGVKENLMVVLENVKIVEERISALK